ncbi:TPA: hypothetical protein ACX6RB_003847 [Photobacterium damselae]
MSRKQRPTDLHLTVNEHLRQQILNGKHPHDEHSKYIVYKVKKLAQRQGISIASALDIFVSNQNKHRHLDSKNGKDKKKNRKTRKFSGHQKRMANNNYSIEQPTEFKGVILKAPIKYDDTEAYKRAKEITAANPNCNLKKPKRSSVGCPQCGMSLHQCKH